MIFLLEVFSTISTEVKAMRGKEKDTDKDNPQYFLGTIGIVAQLSFKTSLEHVNLSLVQEARQWVKMHKKYAKPPKNLNKNFILVKVHFSICKFEI